MKNKEDYLKTINLKETNETLVSLSTYAKEHHIPIISVEGAQFLRQVIRLKEVKSVLELGTAIGYSAILMASINQDINITTLERKESLYLLAKNHIESSLYKNQITLVHQDAHEYTPQQTFDMIFIDAAKAQNKTFFERFEGYLNPKGVIVVDNLLFHTLVGTNQGSRNVRALTRKIDDFNHYLMTRQDYHSVIYPIGDGMSVSIKKD